MQRAVKVCTVGEVECGRGCGDNRKNRRRSVLQFVTRTNHPSVAQGAWESAAHERYDRFTAAEISLGKWRSHLPRKSSEGARARRQTVRRVTHAAHRGTCAQAVYHSSMRGRKRSQSGTSIRVPGSQVTAVTAPHCSCLIVTLSTSKANRSQPNADLHERSHVSTQ